MDSEAEFLKTCEQVKVKQAEARAQNEQKQKYLNKIIQAVEQSRSSTTIEYQEKKLQIDRRERIDKIRRALKTSIPFAFWGAHLRKLNRPFASQLTNYDFRIGLVLVGSTGTGKTFAMASLMRRFIASGQACVRIGWEMLCIEIRGTYQKDSTKTEEQILKRLLWPRHLFIEDIGAGKAIDAPETDFAKRILYVLIDTRLENGLPTYITTNKTREQLAASFDERIASRLSCFKWIAVGGNDKRKPNA